MSTKRLTNDLKRVEKDIFDLESVQERTAHELAQLEDQAQADMSGANLTDLESVAASKAAAEVALGGKRAVLEEVGKRIEAKRREAARLDHEIKAIEASHLQDEIDKISLDAAGALERAFDLMQKTDEIHYQVITEYGITPFAYFSRQWRNDVEHRLDIFRKEWAEKHAK